MTTAERAGNRTSEDRIFNADNAVIVLDGASEPDMVEHDGGWLAETVGAEVQHRLTAEPDAELSPLLHAAISTVGDTYRLTAGRAPCTTISILRWFGEHVDALVLGDSPVAVQHHDHTELVRDDRLTHVAPAEHRAYVDAVAANGGDSRPVAEWRALVEAQRAQRNRPGGYWIAEASPDAANHAVHQHWHREQVTAALVVTDGVARGVDEYGIVHGWPEAVAAALDNPATLVDAVHNAEASDPQCQHWKRSKRHDDKAAAIIDFRTPTADEQSKL